MRDNKRRRRGRGHVTQRRGKWWAVVSVGVDDAGKRQRRWLGPFPTQKAAETALTDTLKRVDEGTYIAPSRETLGAFLARWIEGRRDALRPSTWDSYRGLITAYIVPAIGGVKLQALKPAHLAAFYAALRENGRKRDGKPLSRRTVRYIHTIIGRALRDAERWGDVPRNVARLVEAPGTGTAARPCWSLEEAGRFLTHTHADRLAPLWRLAIVSGARRGELLAAAWDDLDDSGLRISRALVDVDGELVISPPKTDRGTRVVPLDEPTLALLRAHRKRQIAEQLKAGTAWEALPLGFDLIFRDELGRPLRPQAVLRAFQRASKQAGVPVTAFHSLRHLAAVLHARTGTPPTVAAEILGHDVRVLQGIYQAHAQPDLAREAVRKIAEHLG